MFSKKCPNCNKKIKNDYGYCPFCGNNLNSKNDREDYGFLGKSDLENPQDSFGLGDTFLDKIFNNAMKVLEKQMKNLSNELQNENLQKTNQHPGNLNVQFFVNGKRVNPNPQLKQQTNQPQQKQLPKIHPDKLKQFAKFPKKEPETRIKRLSGKIIYELEVPGVNDLDNILINQLETSIEIKALGKNKVYTKTLNISLPILRYGLNQDTLIIEFQGR